MGIGEREEACQWALTRKRTLWGGALEVGDLRILEDGGKRGGALISDVILGETVSEGWRGDAVKEQACQRVLTQKRTRRGGALELGHGASLEPLAQLDDALGGVGALSTVRVDATELIVGQAAKLGKRVSMGADTKANTSGAAAHSRLVIFVLLREAASAITLLAPMSLALRLRARGRVATVRE